MLCFPLVFLFAFIKSVCVYVCVRICVLAITGSYFHFPCMPLFPLSSDGHLEREREREREWIGGLASASENNWENSMGFRGPVVTTLA